MSQMISISLVDLVSLTSYPRMSHFINMHFGNDVSLYIPFLAVNCIDRHMKERADEPALIWETDEPGQEVIYSYRLNLSF